MPMKALTLHQPWASAIAFGLKTIETRSWQTNYRGPIAIHAGKSVKGAELEEYIEEFQDLFPTAHARMCVDEDYSEILPVGGIVAIAQLVDVVPTNEVPMPDQNNRRLGNFAIRRFAWMLGDIERVAFAPFSGSQGLWNLPGSVRLRAADDGVEA